MKTYSVWVCVEEHDDTTDSYRDQDLNFTATAEFKTFRKAERFANLLHNVGEQLPGGNENEGGLL